MRRILRKVTSAPKWVRLSLLSSGKAGRDIYDGLFVWVSLGLFGLDAFRTHTRIDSNLIVRTCSEFMKASGMVFVLFWLAFGVWMD